MAVQRIKEGIYSVGAVDWERRLFDELIPLPDGTSYNAYLIEGSQKNVLVDTVDPSKEDVLIGNLNSLGKRVDYIVSNHAEQDHSGAIAAVLDMYPGCKVITNRKCMDFLMKLLHIPEERFEPIEDRQSISLGGRTLEFILMPWVHWPETMVSYLHEDKILFSCDLFGSHLATSKVFADESVYEPAKRYYAEIMMPFRAHIKRHMELIDKLDIEMIAPSHGPIYDNPSFIMDAYRDWIGDQTKNEVVIAYVSMHGSTRVMVKYLSSALVKRGINIKVFDLTVTDIGKLAEAVVDATTVVLACPTVLAGAHPAGIYIAALLGALRPKTRYITVIGSYLWGGKMLDQLKGLLANLRAEFIEPVIVNGLIKEEEFKFLDQLAERILEAHKSLFGSSIG